MEVVKADSETAAALSETLGVRCEPVAGEGEPKTPPLSARLKAMLISLRTQRAELSRRLDALDGAIQVLEMTLKDEP